jgi:hypothetical protein
MKTGSIPFNIYLSAAVLLLLAGGCETSGTYESQEDKPDKQLSALRLHIESSHDATDRTIEVPVFRARPILVTIERSAFITEGNVIAAEVVDEPGGFSIQVEFEREGKWLLEKYTAGNMGRRIAVFASFGHERWLAAVQIRRVISDGKLTFTPDATREEALRIVRGLKNYAKKMDHDPRF